MNGILICKGKGYKKNIGDDIQSIAQEQFFETIDCFVERETVNSYKSSEKTNLIMNAWWMWNPDCFPPSNDINPLFVSFHIVPKIAERLLTENSVKYLKKYEPIGCRDYGTKQILEAKGIKAYFSGCLTLTLGLKYKNEKHGDEIIFVDPVYELGGKKCTNKLLRSIHAILLFVKHFKKTSKFKKGFESEFMRNGEKYHLRWLTNRIASASFYEAYSKVFSDDVLFNATYINHSVIRANFDNMNTRIDYARDLLKKYASAKTVVTSRIHCALPCLGIETPVVFITSESLASGSLRSAGRFKGNIELFNLMELTDDGVKPSENMKEFLKDGVFDSHVSLRNPDNYKQLRDKLITTVKHFVKDNA